MFGQVSQNRYARTRTSRKASLMEALASPSTRYSKVTPPRQALHRGWLHSPRFAARPFLKPQHVHHLAATQYTEDEIPTGRALHTRNPALESPANRHPPIFSSRS